MARIIGIGTRRVVLMLVGEHEVAGARADGVLGLGADALEPLAQRVGAGADAKVQSMKATWRAELLAPSRRTRRWR